MLRHDMQYTAEEARMPDIMLMLHAEHGGGNNSTFTTRVLTSSGTDAYSAYAAVVSARSKGHAMVAQTSRSASSAVTLMGEQVQ